MIRSLGGASGWYSFNGYTSHASLRACGTQLGGPKVKMCLETGEMTKFFEYGKCLEKGKTTKSLEYGKCLEKSWKTNPVSLTFNYLVFLRLPFMVITMKNIFSIVKNKWKKNIVRKGKVQNKKTKKKITNVSFAFTPSISPFPAYTYIPKLTFASFFVCWTFPRVENKTMYKFYEGINSSA